MLPLYRINFSMIRPVITGDYLMEIRIEPKIYRHLTPFFSFAQAPSSSALVIPPENIDFLFLKETIEPTFNSLFSSFINFYHNPELKLGLTLEEHKAFIKKFDDMQCPRNKDKNGESK